jgi:hypothetical protein
VSWDLPSFFWDNSASKYEGSGSGLATTAGLGFGRKNGIIGFLLGE